MDSEGSDSGSEEDTSTKPLGISSGPNNRLIHTCCPEVGQQAQVYVSEHCVLNYVKVVRV